MFGNHHMNYCARCSKCGATQEEIMDNVAPPCPEPDSVIALCIGCIIVAVIIAIMIW